MRNNQEKFKTKIKRAAAIHCQSCNLKMQTDEAHEYHGKTMCEDCFIDIKMRPKRLPHWQYLRSIKSDYLQPGRPKP
jgi:hypothetical protein